MELQRRRGSCWINDGSSSSMIQIVPPRNAESLLGSKFWSFILFTLLIELAGLFYPERFVVLITTFDDESCPFQPNSRNDNFVNQQCGNNCMRNRSFCAGLCCHVNLTYFRIHSTVQAQNTAHR
jgi:hypothetical protein